MKRSIVLVVVGLCVLSVGMAGAYFTGQAQVPENVIRAGAVAISSEPTSAALDIDALAPGVAVTRQLTVVNDGNLPVSAVVTGAKKAGYTDLYNALDCRVTADGKAVYGGTLSALRTAAVRVVPGDRCRMQFSVSLPATATNDLMGDYCKLTLYIDAEQTQ